MKIFTVNKNNGLLREGSMEKRKDVRLKVENTIKTRINQEGDFTVKDLSTRGMCLECESILKPITLHDFEICFDLDRKVMVKGVVVRCFLKRLQVNDENSAPVYQTGIKFTEINEHDKNKLEELIATIG